MQYLTGGRTARSRKRRFASRFAFEYARSVADSLLDRARQGDRAALEELLAQQAPVIYRFSLRMCRNVADAEDTLQDTLLSIANHVGKFAGRASLSSWIFALTRSACARRRRGLKNRPTENLDDAPPLPSGRPSPEEHAGQHELTAALTAALDQIPETYREVLLLRDMEGLSASEAAEALGVSVDALKSRLHRARQALREALHPILEAEAPRPGPACPDIISAWSRKLEDELSSNDCAAMEQHIRSCLSCGAACNALKRSLSACQRIGTEEVPPAVQAQVKAAMRRFLKTSDALQNE